MATALAKGKPVDPGPIPPTWEENMVPCLPTILIISSIWILEFGLTMALLVRFINK